MRQETPSGQKSAGGRFFCSGEWYIEKYLHFVYTELNEVQYVTSEIYRFYVGKQSSIKNTG
ncbi:hypothetical protein AGMMS50268_28050 [Spirochaetia bacterium]|nr:hypothetical protein AGMMS50268_28050 [Spirochaetia bacterium]